MTVIECNLCAAQGVECQDYRPFPFLVKRRAVFVRGVQMSHNPPIDKCEAVMDNSKIEEVANQIVYEAGQKPEMYFGDYDPEL